MAERCENCAQGGTCTPCLEADGDLEPLRTTAAAAAAVALIRAMVPRPVPGDTVRFDLDRTGFPVGVRIERAP